MIFPRQAWLGAGCLLASLAAWAHHSTAMYDYSKEKSISGVVSQWQYTNPHCYIELVVPDGKGGQTKWSIEAGTVSSITARLGWNKSSLKPGDKITALISPVRDGSPAGTLRSVTFEDGRVLKTPTADVKGDATGKPELGLRLPQIERATPKDQGQ